MGDNGTGRVRALIVDDEELGRRILRTLLSADQEVQVVGEAASAVEARRRIAEPRPYVIYLAAHPQFASPALLGRSPAPQV